MNVNWISERFHRFALNECKGSSPLYESLSLNISKDEDLLRLCLHANNGQPIPNLLFASVHYLLLKGYEHLLREYYPSLVKEPKQEGNVYPIFKDFCFTFQEEIKELLQTKRVQTNEVRRCAYLYPLFCFIFEKTKTPLALIELGTSAGLLLLWDEFAYSYGDEKVYGNQHASLHLQTEIRGSGIPPLLKQSPPVSTRIGIDLHVVDVTNQDDAMWLTSLIWPEHQERLAYLEKAIHQFHITKPTLIEGDGVELLKVHSLNIPENETLCIFHTHVANQIPDEVKYELMKTIEEIGQTRDVFHIYNNIWDRLLHIDYVLDGKEHKCVIGRTDGHGRWFEWNN